jgi:DNA (cytosine-5)-methyltransferase 1
MGYAFGCVPFPSTGVGAPHIRDRAYWVADSNDMQPEQSARQGTRPGETQGGWTLRELAGCGHVGGVVQPNSARCEPGQSAASPARHGDSLEPTSAVPRPSLSARELAGIPYSGKFVDPARNTGARDLDTGGRPGPTNGAWADADWLFCRDGKWRPVEPGTLPLAHGVTNRVGKLRAYGNAINAQAAKTFIESYLEC